MNRSPIAWIAIAATLSLDSGAQEPSGGAARYDGQPLPTDPSKAPAPDEWDRAATVRIRAPRPIGNCGAKLLREWIAIRCEGKMAGAGLVAGSAAGVAIAVDEKDGTFVAITFPLRPGDRRVFELFGREEQYGGEWPASAMILDEQWLEGATSPEIAAYPR